MAFPITRQKLYTPEEYLTFERQTEEKHEWLDGEIYAMAGSSPSHSAITANVTVSLGVQLIASPFGAFTIAIKNFWPCREVAHHLHAPSVASGVIAA